MNLKGVLKIVGLGLLYTFVGEAIMILFAVQELDFKSPEEMKLLQIVCVAYTACIYLFYTFPAYEELRLETEEAKRKAKEENKNDQAEP